MSRFNLSFADGRGERLADNYLLERGRFGGGSVLVWGRIMGGRKTGLIVIPGILTVQRDKFELPLRKHVYSNIQKRVTLKTENVQIESLIFFTFLLKT